MKVLEVSIFGFFNYAQVKLFNKIDIFPGIL